MKTPEIQKISLLLGGAFLATSTVQASTDFGPATYRPMSGCTKWYTSGNGHKFVVIHDMEGYYASTISYLNRCDVSVSIHYMVNGLKDASSDYPAGDIDQQVREANYAWHARCWNTWMYGTEHEGFASNPAWFTEEMYANSATLQRHLCNGASIPKDRNHVIGHNQKSVSGWSAWVNANYSFDPNCNSHTDPGPSWNWTKFMGYITGAETGTQTAQSPADGTSIAPGATFTYSITLQNSGGTPWIGLGGTEGYTLNYLSGTQMGWTQKTMGANVLPGGSKTFSQTLTAPTAAGTYTLNTRLNNADDLYFGPTYSLTITVGGVNSASAVSDTAPTHVTAGKTFSATVVMNNNGGTTWTTAGGYKLGSQDAQDNTTWGFTRVALPASIAPGANATFTFTGTAPTTPGTYSFDWQMVQEGVMWFGTKATATIIVDPLENVIVDDADPGFTFNGSWILITTGADQYGSGFHYRSTGYVLDATWTANLAHTGTYKVYAWWTQGGNRSTTAPYSVNGGTAVIKNQQANGGTWNLLGTYSLNAGNNTVSISANTTSGSIVVADAVRFEEQ